MSEPSIDAEYVKKTQDIITAVPAGPWEVDSVPDGRLPDQVGPICFLETWVHADHLPVIQFISHAREALPRYMGAYARQQVEIDRLRQEIAAARQFADQMREYCSPHGVSGMYADRLIDAMDRAKGVARDDR
ncbi:hypothetical protein [Streptomyces chartreusis]|uniref:hypothetical protein n=1 Tax=Streptomyces chartreusis TaxID=1969 RepID=UPI0037F63053